LRQRFPAIPADLDSIIYVDRSSGAEEVSWRSEAFLRICRLLRGPWPMVAVVAGWLPRSLTDAAYGAFARRRHVFGGPPETCQVPSPVERARFLP
jgi:predicted DCC family thiol-disulfide oxidoreductase YuxK